VDKKNQLDVTFCILYFSSNSCSTCFGQPCAHGRTTCQPDLTTSLRPRHIPTRGYNITQSWAPDDGHMVVRNMLSNLSTQKFTFLPLQNSLCIPLFIYKGKAVPLQAWTGPEGFRKLRFPDFVTTVRCQSYAPAAFTPRKYSWYSFLLHAESTPRAIVRSGGFYANEKSTDTSWDRTSDLPICSTAP